MDKKTLNVVISVNEHTKPIIRGLTEGESDIVLEVNLIANNTPFSLVGANTPKLTIEKPNGTIFQDTGTITNAEKGVVQINMNSNYLTEKGTYKLVIELEDNTSRVVTEQIIYFVNRRLDG